MLWIRSLQGFKEIGMFIKAFKYSFFFSLQNAKYKLNLTVV